MLDMNKVVEHLIREGSQLPRNMTPGVREQYEQMVEQVKNMTPEEFLAHVTFSYFFAGVSQSALVGDVMNMKRIMLGVKP